ncbi:femo cofactor biosynthesis protein [Pectobacterium atrosepticum SCRI1043]|uniref:FeMo cofactor biosynthesis protein NifB n=1 Tax=Pectobacterium atrosepticum (strain SCRI 1043 / ATCC BAA-672) TaxID=218491 RepID=Q6D307_PECAS|nr:nitrogenase cofactor biosynthesis protein NifB [Pectobacterium atrosepticum]MCL6315084.1 nitrogenase cofactor biosynthesis protein NifB [Pectobacterium atrosepticum]MCL6320680.1 nitrogenase cofactor biosynthesis protein NifB [Pectobacterium atrosepticum]CAG75837.1 femo cofactor biosynthesis protein [Pectobacterium atrosepticum SCRI1043]
MASCSSASGTVGCRSTLADGITPLQASKAAHHPCYSVSGHHRFARMHLAVAPACNVQCNYCNRKYDCSNESRPGVVSTLLTPEQAVAQARQVAAAIPQLSVVGIAGPGDPLANMKRTFSTLRLLREQMPDVKLCLSTNGLMLPEAVVPLLDIGVDHVTVTLNTLDPAVAARIYAWLWLEGERYTGLEAGRILLAKQEEGIRRLTEHRVLVKINSVLIPDINEASMRAVSEKAHSWGAFLHNIMPLIARPEHGTVFGLEGQREPDAECMTRVRAECGQVMPQMSHCQQCRADAIGMLGDDRSQQFPLSALPEKPQPYLPLLHQRAQLHASIASQGESEEPEACLVAVASSHGEVIDLHFGHAERFQIYSLSPAGVVLVNERFTPKYCHSEGACPPEENTERLSALLALLADVDAVFCARIGFEPWNKLEQQGIQPCIEGAWQNVTEVLTAWWQQRQGERLNEQKDKGAA